MEITLRTNRGSKKDELISILGDTIALAQKWCKPKEKREPFPWLLHLAFRDWVRQLCSKDITAQLGIVAAIFDWLCLGAFTGSRAGEHCQTSTKKGQYAKAPMDKAAGEWQGTAKAFLAADFVILDRQMHILPHSQQVLATGSQVFELHVRFRYDKSKKNFTIRKFWRGSGFFCPIEAALSILRRAKLLGVSKHEPLAVYRCNAQGHCTYLRSSEVISAVRRACKMAFPDKQHFLRVNIKRLVAHSNRVTAAMALKARGWNIPRIAFRLRWDEKSVEHYIREASSEIDDMTAAAIAGAVKL